MSGRVVIVGGGLAGQRCAETLRRSGHEEPIVIVCEEPHRPYDRPPLSKEVLMTEGAEESVSFRPEEWYEQKGIELRSARRPAPWMRPAGSCSSATGASSPMSTC